MDEVKSIESENKICTVCKVSQPVENFYMQDKSRRRSACKSCYSIHNKNMREKHAEKRRKYDIDRGSGWDRAGREKYSKPYSERWRDRIFREYNLTPDQYDSMLDRQNGVCAICKKQCNRTNSKRLCVDHCHETGAVRGLLCFKCNVGLGRFDDKVELLKLAILYLEKSR